MPFKLDGARRIDDSDVLMTIREAVMNSLIHADYAGRGGITVIYDGIRITVKNPGTLRIPLETARKGGVSDPRNKTLMRMMSNIGMVERMGSGIVSMFDSMANGSILGLTIEETVNPDAVKTVVTLQPPGIRSDERESRILRFLSENPRASMEEISKATGIPTRTLSRIVAGLIEKGALVRIGTYRNTEWLLKRRPVQDLINPLQIIRP